MPISSAEISGLVGGQTAMFSNQHSYAQQLSGMYGAGPQTNPTGMQNPFPNAPSYAPAAMPFTGWRQDSGNTGANIVGGMAQAAPAALSGLAFAGGMGVKGLEFLDPITMGMSAGRAMGMGAGVATGGMMMAGYYAAETAAKQVYTGAQNVSDVGRMAGAYMGPQFGESGARPGGQMARGNIKAMVSVLEDIASQDVMVTIESAKRLMDKFGQMGMLTGIGDAQTFRTKYSALVKQAGEVAKILGTSLEEAAPALGQFRQMGLWTTKDVMGAAGAVRQVGAAAAPALMGAMGAGAQMSTQMGGNMGAGARIGAGAFMNVQAALRTGTMTEEQMMEMTGGVGGTQGQGMVAQQLGGAMSNMANTPMGRLMMAGLGQFEGGRFTGGIDQQLMKKFQRGEISTDELQRMGRQRTGTKQGAVSWEVQRGKIGQEMMAQGGMEGMAAAVGAVLDKTGYGEAGEDIKNMMIQKMTGVDARMADMIRKMGDDMPRIMSEKRRRAEAELDDRMRQIDTRLNHSIRGMKEAFGKAAENWFRPLREVGADMASSLSTSLDATVDTLTGRTKGIQFSGEQRLKMQAPGGRAAGYSALAEMGGGTNAGALTGSTPLAERMRNFSGSAVGAVGPIGALYQAATGGMAGTRVETLARLGAEFGGRTEDVRMAMAGAIRRGTSQSATGLLPQMTPEDNRDLADVSHAMRSLGANQGALRDLTRRKQMGLGGTAGDTQSIVDVLQKHDPRAAEALRSIVSRRRKEGGGTEISNLEQNIVAAAGEQAGLAVGNAFRPGWEQEQERAAGFNNEMMGDPKVLAEKADAAIKSAAAAQVTTGETWLGRYAALELGALAAVVPGGVWLAGKAAAFGKAWGSGSAVKEAQLRELVGKYGSDFVEKVKTGKSSAYLEAATAKDPTLQKFLENMPDTKEFKEGVENAYKFGQATDIAKNRERINEDIALTASGRLGQAGLSAPLKEDVQKLIDAYKDGASPANMKVIEELQTRIAGMAGGSPEQQEALEKLGGLGEHLAAGARVSGWTGKRRGGGTINNIEQFEKEMGRVEDAGLRSDIELYAQSGGIDEGEAKELKERMMKMYAGAEARPGAEDPQTKYMNAQIQYVQVATEAIIKLQGNDNGGIVDKLKDKANAVVSNITGASTTPDQKQ